MKKKIIIGIGTAVVLILLALAVFCFTKQKNEKDVDTTNGTTSITTEITTTTATEITDGSLTETMTTTSNSTEPETGTSTTDSNTETTLTEDTTVAQTTTGTTNETTVESVETTSNSEVVSTVFLSRTTVESLKTTTKKEKQTTPAPAPKKGKTLIKTFTRGTYYAYGGPRKGGSGRQLINCATGGQGVKGSIASWYLYKKLGYNYKGKRTKVYLEIKGYPKMNGWYYLDDSCAPGYNNVCDFFYINGKSCPFSRQGVVQVKCYI